MSITIHCPGCKALFGINPRHTGLQFRCPKCKNDFSVDSGGTARALPRSLPAAAATTRSAPRPAQAPAPVTAPALPRTPPGVARAAPVRAPQPAARPVAVAAPAAVRAVEPRPPLPAEDINQTIDGQMAPTDDMLSPPPLHGAATTAPSAAKGTAAPGSNGHARLPFGPSAGPSRQRAGLRWALLGSLLTVVVASSCLGAYYAWQLYNTSAEPGSAEAAGAAESSAPAVANAIPGRWGAIEIGAKGIKAMVIDVFETDEKGNYDFNVVMDTTANPTLVAAGADGKSFDPRALANAEDIVKRFWTEMRDKHQLPPERLLVMCSSGLFVPFARDEDALARNRAALAERVKAAAGCPVTFITAKDEARLAMQACVPPRYWNEVVFLDVGSGNTKGGYFEDVAFLGLDVDLGSVTYAKKVMDEAKQSGKPFAEQAALSRPLLLEQPLREQIDRMPGIAKQKKIQLAGGAVWALATFTHPNDTKPRVALTVDDVARYALLVRKPENEVRDEVLKLVSDPGQRKAVDKEIGRIQKIFKPENLQAGAEILVALSREFRFEDKQLSFFRKSHLAWPLGYVLEKNARKS